jgi:hypothetical protein
MTREMVSTFLQWICGPGNPSVSCNIQMAMPGMAGQLGLAKNVLNMVNILVFFYF